MRKMYRNKRKEYLWLIPTGVSLDEEEIIRISLSYDAMTAHTAVVFTRYMLLLLESRESYDNRSLGELFIYLSDEKIDELMEEFMNALPALLKTQLLCIG